MRLRRRHPRHSISNLLFDWRAFVTLRHDVTTGGDVCDRDGKDCCFAATIDRVDERPHLVDCRCHRQKNPMDAFIDRRLYLVSGAVMEAIDTARYVRPRDPSPNGPT